MLPADQAKAARRVERELRRLEALAARKRARVRILRFLRGGAGAATTFGTLVKLKLAGSLALKLFVAVIAGLGFAWPLAALVFFASVLVAFAFGDLIFGDGGSTLGDAVCDCGEKEKRAARLDDLITQRRSWLAAPSGRAPSLLRAGAKHRAGAAA